MRALLVIMALTATTPAFAGPTAVAPVEKRIVYAGKPYAVQLSPTVEVTGGPGTVTLNVTVAADMTDVAAALRANLSHREQKNACGDHYEVKLVALEAGADGSLLARVDGHAEIWGCASAFGKQIYKTKVIQQDANAEASIKLVAAPNGVAATVSVRSVGANGLLGLIAPAFGLDRLVVAKVNDALNKALAERAVVAFPPELAKYRPVIKSITFANVAGRLVANASGSITINQANVADLIGQALR